MMVDPELQRVIWSGNGADLVGFEALIFDGRKVVHVPPLKMKRLALLLSP
jgi:hypothetical protein